jgi:hypothetical protein
MQSISMIYLSYTISCEEQLEIQRNTANKLEKIGIALLEWCYMSAIIPSWKATPPDPARCRHHRSYKLPGPPDLTGRESWDLGMT